MGREQKHASPCFVIIPIQVLIEQMPTTHVQKLVPGTRDELGGTVTSGVTVPLCQREQHLRPRMALPEPSFRGTYSRAPCHSQRSPGLTLVPGPILSVLCAVGWSWRLRCAPRPAPATRAVTLGVRVWRPRHRVTRRVGRRGGHLPVAPPGLPGRHAFLRLQTRSIQGTAGAALWGGGDPRRRPWPPPASREQFRLQRWGDPACPGGSGPRGRL